MFTIGENLKELLLKADMEEVTMLGFLGLNANNIEAASRTKWEIMSKVFLSHLENEDFKGMIATRNVVLSYLTGKVLLAAPLNIGDVAQAFMIIVVSCRKIEHKLKLDSLIDAGKQMLCKENIPEEEIRGKLRAKYNLYDKKTASIEIGGPELIDDTQLLM